ncbi:6-bladed beta-propeller [Gemmatimonadota bacterium]
MAHRSVRLLAVGLIIPAAAAVSMLDSCSSSDATAKDHTFEVTVVEGVTRAVSSSVPKYSEPLFEYEEVLWLNQDYDRPESLLNRVGQTILGDDGCFYLVDYGDQRIVVFDSEGEYSHSIGREGEGPGEFRYPSILWIRDGRLAVYDQNMSRTQIFSTDGTYLTSHSLPLIGGNAHILYPLEDCYVLLGAELDFSNPEQMKQLYWGMVVTADGDTLCRVEAKPWSMGRRINVPGYNTSTTSMPYYAADSSLNFHEGFGFLCFCTDEPILRWHGLDGELEREIVVEMEPEPVTDAERRGIQRSLQRSIDNATDDRRKAMAEARKKHADIPNVKTYWSFVMVDDQDYHWLSYHYDYSLEEDTEQKARFRILSPEGEYLGDTEYPEGYGQVSKGHFVTPREDEETGEILQVVYRLVPAAEGFVYP